MCTLHCGLFQAEFVEAAWDTLMITGNRQHNAEHCTVSRYQWMMCRNIILAQKLCWFVPSHGKKGKVKKKKKKKWKCVNPGFSEQYTSVICVSSWSAVYSSPVLLFISTYGSVFLYIRVFLLVCWKNNMLFQLCCIVFLRHAHILGKICLMWNFSHLI